jgi:hypothetical protein
LSFELVVVVSRSRNWFDKLTAGCAPRFAKASDFASAVAKELWRTSKLRRTSRRAGRTEFTENF